MTMVVATAAWAIGEILARRSPLDDRRARVASTLAVALALIHAGLAFEFVYQWNHDIAAVATMRQAEDSFGWGWSGGIYVNYVFLAIWIVDVSAWWAAPAWHTLRSRRLETMRRAFFVFMFINGSIVFASGFGRLVGVASVSAVLLAPFARPRRKESS